MKPSKDTEPLAVSNLVNSGVVGRLDQLVDGDISTLRRNRTTKKVAQSIPMEAKQVTNLSRGRGLVKVSASMC